MMENHGYNTELIVRPPLDLSAFDKLQGSTRFDHLYLYNSETACSQDEKELSHDEKPGGQQEQQEQQRSNYFYRLTVVDRTILPTTSTLNFATAVFLIPAGRESEYIFSSHKGLLSIAESANCARLIAVAFGRSFSLPSSLTISNDKNDDDEIRQKQQQQQQQASLVQQELAEIVQLIAREGKFLPTNQLKKKFANQSIPFMASSGIGSRNILAEGNTTMSGKYLIEQVQIDNDMVVRRLYFKDNPFVIQSEVSMIPCSNNDTTDSNEDDSKDRSMMVDKSYLAFDYHKDMVAGTVLLASSLFETDTNETSVSKEDLRDGGGCVIGLGGGGLVNFFQHTIFNDAGGNTATPTLTVVELDPSVVHVAENYFGFSHNHHPHASTHVVVGDGLDVGPTTSTTSFLKKEDANDAEAVPATSTNDESGLKFEPHSLSFIAIDVDSKDNTVGMSCPPAEFCSIEYLTTMQTLLKQNGSVLVINVSARDPKMANLVSSKVQSVFGSVFVVERIDDDDDNEEDKDSEAVNVVLLATSQPDFVPPSKQQICDQIDLIFGKTMGKEDKNTSLNQRSVSKDLISDLKSCRLIDWSTFCQKRECKNQTDLTGSGSNTKGVGMTNNNNTKNRKKKKGKRGKRK